MQARLVDDPVDGAHVGVIRLSSERSTTYPRIDRLPNGISHAHAGEHELHELVAGSSTCTRRAAAASASRGRPMRRSSQLARATADARIASAHRRFRRARDRLPSRRRGSITVTSLSSAPMPMPACETSLTTMRSSCLAASFAWACSMTCSVSAANPTRNTPVGRRRRRAATRGCRRSAPARVSACSSPS